jgi:hypothetical protein
MGCYPEKERHYLQFPPFFCFLVKAKSTTEKTKRADSNKNQQNKTKSTPAVTPAGTFHAIFAGSGEESYERASHNS